MPLEKKTTGSPEDSQANAEALQRSKADKAPYIDRAPVSADPFSECWQYAKGGSGLTHWKRHPVSGAWYSAAYA